MTTRTRTYPKTEHAIRAFAGPDNARLRRIIRKTLDAGQDVRTLARTVALTGLGTAKLQTVYDAWTEETHRQATPSEPCAYCHAEIPDGEPVPALDDEETWMVLALDHADDCEWIRTRAHRRDVA